MKKITLFIAFFAISIGSVWGDVTLFEQCSSTASDVPFSLSNQQQTIQLKYDYSTFKSNATMTSVILSNITAVEFFTSSGSEIDEGYFADHFTFKISISASLPNDDYKVCQVSFADNKLTLSSSAIGTVNLENTSLYVNIKVEPKENATFSSTSGVLWCVDPGHNNAVTKTNGSSSPTSYDMLPKITFVCGVKYDGVVGDDGCTYNVYKASGTSSNEASLVKYNWQNSKTRYFTYSSDVNGSNLSFKVYRRTFEVASTVGFSNLFGNLSVAVTGIEGEPFYDEEVFVEDNTAIILPSITYIGKGNGSTVSLRMKFKAACNDVAIILTGSLLPYLNLGSNDLISVKNPDAPVNVVGIYLTKLYSGTTPSFNDEWNDKMSGKIKSSEGNGFVSYPYFVKALNTYGKDVDYSIKYSNGSPDIPVYISVLPFGTQPLKVKVSDVLYASSDGSFHYYTKINKVDKREEGSGMTSENCGGAEYSVDLTKETEYSIYTDCSAELMYGKGEGRFDYSSDVVTNDKLGLNGTSQNKIFKGSNALTFRVHKNQENKYDNEKVPYWYFVGGDNDNSLQTDAAIHVEKVITSKHYRYFCLPFACNVKDIDVRLIDSDGKPEGNSLDRYVGNFTESITQDYYVINEYKGQSDGFGDKAVYGHPDLTNNELCANKPYAFALVLQNENNPRQAIITFKSRGDSETEGFALKEWNHAEDISVYERPRNAENGRNSGWNMIGNPYFHYLKASSFYGTSTKNDETTTHQVKYITLINVMIMRVLHIVG